MVARVAMCSSSREKSTRYTAISKDLELPDRMLAELLREPECR